IIIRGQVHDVHADKPRIALRAGELGTQLCNLGILRLNRHAQLSNFGILFAHLGAQLVDLGTVLTHLIQNLAQPCVPFRLRRPQQHPALHQHGYQLCHRRIQRLRGGLLLALRAIPCVPAVATGRIHE
ncbi:hypothetical protein BCR44DRAFT_1429537, partial [Catenaria anguillulae PL171]